MSFSCFLSSDYTFENFFSHPHDFFLVYLRNLCFVCMGQLKGTLEKHNLAHNSDIVKVRFYETFTKAMFHKIKIHLRNVYLIFEVHNSRSLKCSF